MCVAGAEWALVSGPVLGSGSAILVPIPQAAARQQSLVMGEQPYTGRRGRRWGGCRSPQTASQCAKLAVLKHKLKERASMGEVTIIGVDLAKNVFQVHGAAADGSVVFGKKLSRPQFARYTPSRD